MLFKLCKSFYFNALRTFSLFAVYSDINAIALCSRCSPSLSLSVCPALSMPFPDCLALFHATVIRQINCARSETRAPSRPLCHQFRFVIAGHCSFRWPLWLSKYKLGNLLLRDYPKEKKNTHTLTLERQQMFPHSESKSFSLIFDFYAGLRPVWLPGCPSARCHAHRCPTTLLCLVTAPAATVQITRMEKG